MPEAGVSGPVVVGSASRDVAAADPRGWRLGGAVSYVWLALARVGLRPRVLLGADPEAASAAELDLLRAAGADLVVVRLDRGPVFDNREVDGARFQMCLEPGDPLPPGSLPDAWRSAGRWAFVPVANELPETWSELPGPDARVALGWQGLLRFLPRGGPVSRRPPGPSGLLARADLVTVSDLDLDPGTDVQALGAFLAPGATLVVTNGTAGGTAWTIRDGRASEPRRYVAIPAERTVDPTGAGDAFLAGLIAGQMGYAVSAAGRRATDIQLAAAVGSLTVEGEGVHAVPEASAVVERIRSSIRPE